MTGKRIHIVQNGSKKIRKQTESAINSILGLSAFVITVYKTNARGDAKRYCAEQVHSNDIVIAVGGDGTCNEVVNGIMEAELANVALGIIPAGTGNDFLKMCVDKSELSLTERLQANQYQDLDIGFVETASGNYHFLNIADMGLGGKVIEIMERQRAIKIGGKFSYASSIIRGFFTYKKPMVRISTEEFSYSGKLMLLGMCNGAVFGHGLYIFPGAQVDDGKLGFTLIGDVTLYDYVKYLSRLKKGLRISHPEVHYIEGKSLELDLLAGNLYGETDGEYMPGSSCKVSVLPSALKLINSLR